MGTAVRKTKQGTFFNDQPLFICYTGIDTELLFTYQQPLPGGASYPLLNSPTARFIIKQIYKNLLLLAKKHRCAVILDTLTWIAHRDRAKQIGINSAQLVTFNHDAIAIMAEARTNYADTLTLLSAQIGPRADAYQVLNKMSVNDAYHYHMAQVQTYCQTDADIITAATLTYAEEAAGIVLAAKSVNIPVVIAFTVENDGRLPSGMTLQQAITLVDQSTNQYACHFMINCAHPEHFSYLFRQQPWERRIRGIVVNASRCSHDELDNCATLDAGNPKELGYQVAELYRHNPQINVIGGCCGTNLNHIEQMVKNIKRHPKVPLSN